MTAPHEPAAADPGAPGAADRSAGASPPNASPAGASPPAAAGPARASPLAGPAAGGAAVELPAPGPGAEDVAAWRRRTAGERRWPVSLAVLMAIALQLVLPARLGLRPSWLLPSLEVALLAALIAANPHRLENRHPALRYGSLVLIGLLSISNAISAALLVNELIHGRGAAATAAPLLANGGAIYGTNVLAFALWYWELDRGGPVARAYADRQHPDFMFPQLASPDLAPSSWEPVFLDYLYLSFTNATAFSPTDTLPLTRGAKSLMALQSAVALLIAALVVARAINILK